MCVWPVDCDPESAPGLRHPLLHFRATHHLGHSYHFNSTREYKFLVEPPLPSLCCHVHFLPRRGCSQTCTENARPLNTSLLKAAKGENNNVIFRYTRSSKGQCEIHGTLKDKEWPGEERMDIYNKRSVRTLNDNGKKYNERVN
jgi:hypothetical protein